MTTKDSKITAVDFKKSFKKFCIIKINHYWFLK